MKNDRKTEHKLIAELESAYQKVYEMEAQLKGHRDSEGNEAEHNQRASDLHESEIRYRRLFEAAKDGILILDAESGAIIDANPFIREILGYSPEDLIGKRLWEIGAFFDVVASKAAFEELQRKEYIRYENLPLQTKDGQLREVEFISNVYLVDLKKVIQCNIRNITKRKEAEQALRESEIRYRRLFESAKDGILILDAETGKIIDANPFLLEILDYSQEEVIGKELWEIGPFKDIIANRDSFRKLQFQEYVRYEHLQLQSRDGVTVHVEFISNFYFMNERKVIQCNIRDITERKCAEQKLQHSEMQYRSLTENSPDLIARFDRQYRHLYVNSTAAKAGRYTPEEYVGKTIIEVGVPEEEARKWEERIKTVFETGQVVEVEDVFETPNGKRYFDTKFVPEFAPDGFIHSVQSIARDITNRRRVEEALRKSEERYRRLFETAQDGILLLDAESGTITDANPFITEMLGYTKEDLIGKRLWEVSAFIDRSASKSAFEELQQKGYIRYENLPLETKDGQSRQVEFVSNVYPVNGKKVIQCNIRDITERKWLEEDKQKLMNKLQEALAHIKELKGLLPICSNCKKIRNDEGYWQVVEGYLMEHTDATFTHGVCPDCMKIIYPDIVQGNREKPTGTKRENI